ncbi:unnamed protein product [Adineta ricciae]|uniref:Uncharacterized protein n=1 Tax=Adineta ricciae TaxID=249248 RepID=A0A813MKU5_ADIRI|nr:unnamed protein product [Adineta ricciae]CAF0774328.1 unnamed protein product [Adineta ricciae]
MRKHSRNTSVSSYGRSICSSYGSADNELFMELTDEHVLRLLDRAIDQHDDNSSMNSRRYLPQVPSQSATMTINNHVLLSSRSAIEDLFHVFENDPEFITMGKRLLNKKRKLEQLRAQLNLPADLSTEDTVKLLQIRERLRAKRKLPTVFVEPEKPPLIQRKSSNSMPDLSQGALTNKSSRASLLDLNASLNSTIYRKRRRRSLFRKQLGPEFVLNPDSKIEKITVPNRNPTECICQVIVLLPNNNRVQVYCKSDATVRIIHETIVSYIDLIEHDLFALTILLDGEYCFPAMDLKISKLVNDPKWKSGQAKFVMQLKIKYFVDDISVLRHFLTQHLFYLQFRQMVLADTFQISKEQKLSFTSLAFQAEYGDGGDDEQYKDEFIIEHYASNDLINEYGTRNLRQEILERQRFYAELNDVQAERMFVENVMKLDDYGYHMYKLYKDTKQDDVYLVGIRLRDVSVWQLRMQQRQAKITYNWDQIERIGYDKKTFAIILKRHINEGKIKYLTNNSKKGKYLFELCYDTYTFTKSLLLRHNSRYSLLNEPINDVEFVRNSSDVDSIDYNTEQSRTQSQENLGIIGKNSDGVASSTMIYEVELYKDNNNSLGMSLMGDAMIGIFIKSIYPLDGSAARSGKIQTGDRLLSYNGKLIHNMTVQEVADVLSLLPDPCRLKLCRYSIPSQAKHERPRRPMSVDAESLFQHEKQNNNSPSALSATWSNGNFSNTLPGKRVLSNESIISQASDLQSAHDIKSAVFPVTIDKTGQTSLGFLVVGGLDSEIEDHGIYVKSITPGGAAAKSKLLIEGDKILEVNGVPLSRVTHAEAVEIFRRATKPKCHLLVQRLILPSRTRSSSITNIYSFARPENTFEVLLNRGQNGLGLSLSGGSAENKPIEIIDIYPDQPAALSGRLKIGDVILSINDVIMHNRNVRDVPSVLADSTRNVKLVVCRPDPQEYQVYLDNRTNGSSKPSRTGTTETINSEQRRVSSDVVRDLPPKSPATRRHGSSKVKRGEVFTVRMDKETDSGFGFTLSAGSTSIGYPHIRSVLREPALSAGLKHWDRILFIDNYDCQTISHRDLVARLRYSPTGPVDFILYRPRIDEIVHAKERSRTIHNTSYTSTSVGDQSNMSNSAPPSPVLPAKTTKPEIFNEPVQYEKIQIVLPKASQGTYGIGLSQIDPQQIRGGIFICALQPNGIAAKDGRLQIDDRLLCINDRNTDQMTYREVVEGLKATTKKGVTLLIARPVTDPSTTNKANLVTEKDISTKPKDTVPSTSATTKPVPPTSSIIDMLIPREKPKLLPLSNTEKTQTSKPVISPDAIESPSASSPAPTNSTIKALFEKKKSRPTPPSNLDISTNQNTTSPDKKKPSPASNTDLDEDTSDIKTPPMSPRSPVAPSPPVLELNAPRAPLKPISTSQSNDLSKRIEYYQRGTEKETLVLNAGVAEKIENLTAQLVNKISTPAITMETATLMDECREIDMKIDSQEYLEEFRALKTLNEHEPAEFSSIATQPKNQSLNRFQNIVPYDFNRVILSTQPDYINASHIVIPIGEKSMKYIICPPPVPDSVNDFWQMIADQRIRCMIGIFNEQDLKKMKCPVYWPTTVKTTMTLSQFLSVTLTKQRQLDGGLDVKEFLVHATDQSSHKQDHYVMFLTYNGWASDENAPNDTEPFLNLIHLAHSYQTNETPLLIHCNTGVGRTGCALLVSLLLIKMIRGRTLDIYTMAKECRRQRSNVIQTQQQYRFVYECARDALNKAIEHSIMQSAQ